MLLVNVWRENGHLAVQIRLQGQNSTLLALFWHTFSTILLTLYVIMKLGRSNAGARHERWGSGVAGKL
jgi:hypothetical protein